MKAQKRYSPEVQERAVRLLFEHRGEYDSEWSALTSIASKIGCTAETLRKWVRRERENKELKRANEILKTASAFFAQAELDRRLK